MHQVRTTAKCALEDRWRQKIVKGKRTTGKVVKDAGLTGGEVDMETDEDVIKIPQRKTRSGGAEGVQHGGGQCGENKGCYRRQKVKGQLSEETRRTRLSSKNKGGVTAKSSEKRRQRGNPPLEPILFKSKTAFCLLSVKHGHWRRDSEVSAPPARGSC